MRRCCLFLGFFLAALFQAVLPAGRAQAENLFPLSMWDAHIAPVNRGEFRVGFDYANDLHNLFQQEDVNRRILASPALFLNLGLGERIEGQISYNYLRLQRDGQETRWGSGDTRIGFKLALLPDCPHRPATTFMVSTKLPNADDDKDFGTDEADNFLELLISEAFGPIGTHLNLGVAILGAPGAQEGQDDLLRYAAGLSIPLGSHLDILVGVQGMDFGHDVNQRGAVQAGLRISLGRLTWDVGGSIGYVDQSEDWGLRTGLSLPVRVAHLPCQSPPPGP